MTPERWDQIDAILDHALTLPPDEQAAYVRKACGDDEALRQEVESILAAEAEAPAFLDHRAADYVDLFDEDAPANPPPPERVGPYAIHEELGRGGMSVVYRAERTDGSFTQTVALKVLQRHFQTPERIARFRAERQILASLDHPNIARVLDGGLTDDGQPYLAMESIQGVPITTYCADRDRPLRARLELLQTVCRAVEHAQQRLVVHRDLKPSNILVTPDGTVKLLDFGIAKLLDESMADLTRTGERPMTPEYAAPEQVRAAPITTATDVYQLGVLAYELLTGCHPFRGATARPSDIERAILETIPTRPSGCPAAARGPIDPDALTGDLDTIVMKALRKEPKRRYASAGEMADDIERHLTGRPVTARPATWRYRADKFIRRNQATLGAVGVIGLLIAAYIATLTIQTGQIAAERNRAQQEAERAERVTQFMIGLFESLAPNETQGESLSAQALLDRGVERLRTNMDEDAGVRAQLFSAIGDVYRKQGRYDQAAALFRDALAAQAALHGPDDPALAPALTDLGTTLTITGAYADADSLLQRGVELLRGASPAQPLATARALNALAYLRRETHRYADAAELYREALALREAHLPATHPDRAESLTNLGLIHVKRDDYATATRYYEEALTIREAQYGPNHTAVAHSLSHLGWLHEQQARYATADSLYRRALAIRQDVLGPDHLATLNSLNLLGWLQYKRGRYAEGLPLLEAALEGYRARLGPNHLYVANARYKQGLLLLGAGQHPAARTAYEEALALRQAERGPDDPYTLSLMSELGEALLEHGPATEAESYLRTALKRQRAIDADPADLAYTRRILGRCLMTQGRYSEAESLLQAAYRADVPTESAEAARDLVALYEQIGAPAQAAAYRTLVTAQ